MRISCSLLSLLFLFQLGHSQNVSINNDGSLPDGSAILDIKSVSKGVLIPRMTLSQRNSIILPATGLCVYQTDGAPGLYINTGTSGAPVWEQLGTAGSDWQKTGNAGTNPATHFIGTTDNQPLIFKINNTAAGRIETNNLFLGLQAGMSNAALYNTGIGKNALFANSTGNENSALGFGALYANTSGLRNTAVGSFALSDNTIGHRNSAIGTLALTSNTEGAYNTANGCAALHTNNTGNENSATGYGALYSNTSGYGNTANGFGSMYNNQLGFYNTATGYASLYTNVTGQYNTATGYLSLRFNSNGTNNMAAGSMALQANIDGNNNAAMGASALSSNQYGNNNTAIGYSALTSNIMGSGNTAVGAYATASGSNMTNASAIGANSVAGASNLMAFGSGNVIKWVFGRSDVSDPNFALQVGTAATNGNGAYLTNGGAWTNTSDINKKEDFSIPDSKEVLRKINALAINKWRYKGTMEYHIGPAAQDFYQSFGLGLDDKSISTIDPAGLLLIAVQEQQKQISELRTELNELRIQLKKIPID